MKSFLLLKRFGGEAKRGTEKLAGSRAFTIQTGMRHYYDDDRQGRPRPRDWEHLMGGGDFLPAAGIAPEE